MRLIVDCEPLGEPVYVDRDMWEKVVLNLVSNAFKFTLEGEIEVASTAQMDAADADRPRHRVGHLRGAAPAHLRAVPPRRRHRARTHEGTGIGLALVQELVRLHGGTVHVESSQSARARRLRVTDSVRAVPSAGRPHRRGPRTSASTGSSADPYLAEASRWLPEGASEDSTLIAALDPFASRGRDDSKRPRDRESCSLTIMPTCAITSGACSPAVRRSQRSQTASGAGRRLEPSGRIWCSPT